MMQSLSQQKSPMSRGGPCHSPYSSSARRVSPFLCPFLLLSTISRSVTCAFELCPGTGLKSWTDVEIVLFEHTEMGTGGLVYNCPTPLCLGNLPMPQFQHYKELPLMLGCGVCDSDDDDHDEEECSTVALGEMAPWFWLHDLPDIPGSYPLVGAAGPLYMGGNIEEATKWLQEHRMDPRGHIKFFRKYKLWHQGELAREVEQGLWHVTAQDPVQALHPIMSSLRLP